MFASRFPCLRNPPRRAYSKLSSDLPLEEVLAKLSSDLPLEEALAKLTWRACGESGPGPTKANAPGTTATRPLSTKPTKTLTLREAVTPANGPPSVHLELSHYLENAGPKDKTNFSSPPPDATTRRSLAAKPLGTSTPRGAVTLANRPPSVKLPYYFENAGPKDKTNFSSPPPDATTRRSLPAKPLGTSTPRGAVTLASRPPSVKLPYYFEKVGPKDKTNFSSPPPDTTATRLPLTKPPKTLTLREAMTLANRPPSAHSELSHHLEKAGPKDKTNISSPLHPVKKALLDHKESNKPNATATKLPMAKPAKNPTSAEAVTPANPSRGVHSNLHSDLTPRDIGFKSQRLDLNDPSQELHSELYPDSLLEEPAIDQLESAYLELNSDTGFIPEEEFFDPSLYSDLPSEEPVTDQLESIYLELYPDTGSKPKGKSFDQSLEGDLGSCCDFIWGGTGPEFEKPNEPAPTPENAPIWPPPLVFGGVCPDLQCEERFIEGRNPIGVRIYHPSTISNSSVKKILYLPSNTTNFFPPPEKVISLLSQTTSATIITPTPNTMALFPGTLHDLLRILSYFNLAYASNTKTAILAAGMAASIATSIAVTEPSIAALGLWGGVLDLSEHSGEVTAWNRKLERWDHFPEKMSPPVPKEAPKLGMTKEEFIAFRRHYYPKPETWADPFASPQLFFRSAGVEFSRQTMRDIFGYQAKELLRQAGSELNIDWGEGNLIYPRPQYSIWQPYPPRDRKTPFPKIRVIIAPEEDKDDVTAEQGIIFVETVRNCLTEWLRQKEEDRDDSRIEAETTVTFERIMVDETWVDEVAAMGNWFNWVFNGSLIP